MSRIKLLCFGYAGSSAQFYKSWRADLHHDMEIVPIELPGRGPRINDQLCYEMDTIVKDAYRQVSQVLSESACQYALFGHSMGTVVIYEFLRKLQLEGGLPNPLHVFFSGRYVPQNEISTPIHSLRTSAFKDRIRELGGTADEVLDDPELCELFMPIIRSDFQALETYCFKSLEAEWDFDLSVIYGTQDPNFAVQDYLGWRQFTAKSCDFYGIDGGHFFIHSHKSEVIGIVNEVLKRNLQQVLIFS
ncbi:thioesterase domain-containing protein [Paenibacillus sp. BR2-3]|uniref:thioesterase II family protein n=1 Tax=Paenibacillus sp. BR2-3 TaxID=3048494 RepID=UPI00397751F4